MNKIIPALDVSKEDALALIEKLKPVENLLAGYKVGSLLVYAHGINVLKEIKNKTDVPIIYDGQKLGTDIPDIVRDQVKLLATADVDQLIVCPMGSGRETLKVFAETCIIQKKKIEPICVVKMTHPGADDFLLRRSHVGIFYAAKYFGIRKFIFPATHPEVFGDIYFDGSETIMATGFKVQGGKAELLRKLGVTEFIVGRAIYQADDPVQAVKDFSKEINR